MFSKNNLSPPGVTHVERISVTRGASLMCTCYRSVTHKNKKMLAKYDLKGYMCKSVHGKTKQGIFKCYKIGTLP